MLTKTAQVFAPASGSFKLDYAGSIVDTGASAWIIPEFTLQEGLAKRLEGIVRFPLLHFQPVSGPAVIAGGQLAMGAKYLLKGGPDANTTISVLGLIEAPTGDSTLIGNATQVMVSILADWHLTRRLIVYTDLSSDTSHGGTARNMSFLGYDATLAPVSERRLITALEYAGSTNTSNGRTQGVIQPDLLFRQGAHLELKVGLPAGVNAISPTLGLYAQIALFWGKS